ncbi:MAG: succinate dehydrogenase [Bacteroidetes bacterium]|nr:MAG: succinate dehydrogenase [Bacteroidota bacterium]
MNWFTRTLTSSIGRKLVMSLTGLFLCSFLVVHLIGNFQLLKTDSGEAFNAYAKFMTTFPLIKFISYGLYAGILLHIIQGILLTLENGKARPVAYAYSKAGDTSSWASRNMGLLGTVIFLFLAGHMTQFWGRMHFGEMPMVNLANGDSVKDLYKITMEAFAQPIMVALYVLAMVALAFHLLHGFKSAFQTLGLTHKKYTPTIETLGYVFAIVIPAAFAVIPILVFLMTNK